MAGWIKGGRSSREVVRIIFIYLFSVSVFMGSVVVKCAQEEPRKRFLEGNIRKKSEKVGDFIFNFASLQEY
jgi:hypothetical protein